MTSLDKGVAVARCTARGVVRGLKARKTILADLAERLRDLVQRQFQSDGPNRLWVADITYIVTWRDFVWAFVTESSAGACLASGDPSRFDLMVWSSR